MICYVMEFGGKWIHTLMSPAVPPEVDCGYIFPVQIHCSVYGHTQFI